MRLVLDGVEHAVSGVEMRPHPNESCELGTLEPGEELRALLADDPYKVRRATLASEAESREIELREISRAPGGRASFVVLSGPHPIDPPATPAEAEREPDAEVGESEADVTDEPPEAAQDGQ